MADLFPGGHCFLYDSDARITIAKGIVGTKRFCKGLWVTNT